MFILSDVKRSSVFSWEDCWDCCWRNRSLWVLHTSILFLPPCFIHKIQARDLIQQTLEAQVSRIRSLIRETRNPIQPRRKETNLGRVGLKARVEGGMEPASARDQALPLCASAGVWVDWDWRVHPVLGRLLQHRVLPRSCQEAGAEEEPVKQEEEGRGEGAEVPPHHCELLQPPQHHPHTHGRGQHHWDSRRVSPLCPAEANLHVPDHHGLGDVADKPTPNPGQVPGLEFKEAYEDPAVDSVKKPKNDVSLLWKLHKLSIYHFLGGWFLSRDCHWQQQQCGAPL